MIKKYFMPIVFAVTLLLQPLTPAFAKTAEQTQFDQIVTEINEKNKSLNAKNENLDNYMYEYKETTPKFSAKDVKLINGYEAEKEKKIITPKDAQKEVAWLFRLLRNHYGLYTYYGGDKKFEKVETNIMIKLKTYKKEIPMKTYEKILYDELKFITDNHFAIGSHYSYSPNISLFGNEKIKFIEKDGKYYLGEKPSIAIDKIDGVAPQLYLKRSIGMDGKLTLLPYTMKKTNDTYKLPILFFDGTSDYITLNKIDDMTREQIFVNESGQNVFTLDTINDIPIFKINMMVFQDGGLMEQIREDIIHSIPKIKKNEHAIIDVRQNSGGDGKLVVDWFETYTGEKLESNYSTIRIRPDGAWRKYIIGSISEYDKLMKQMGLTIRGNYYVANPKKQFISDNKTKLFLRTSRLTASSAEYFTDSLKNLSNVITIGTNTSGTYINGANYSFALPYSNLFFQFGECLFYWDSSYFKEAYGMEPDIWLTGEKEEERFEKFLKTYVQ